MVRLHLPGRALAGPDAADALAVAICHAHHLQSSTHLTAAIAKAEDKAADDRAAPPGRRSRRRWGGGGGDRARGGAAPVSGRGPCADRRARRGLPRPCERAGAGLAAPQRRGGGALHRAAGARGRLDPVRLSHAGGEGMVPPPRDRAGGGGQGGAGALGALGPDALGRAIALGDWATLARAKGVGPRTAQRSPTSCATGSGR
jgi:hypothetical protein